MKRYIFCFLGILFVGIICTHVLDGVPQEEWDADNFGKVIGQIVDPETGNPVNEVFIIDFLDCNEIDTSKNFLRQIRTNEKGFFSVEMKPFVYCLRFYPNSKNSKYSFEPYPFYNDKYVFMVTVEKGKITEFRKVATIGGTLKIKLINTEGGVINPQLEFEKFERIAIFLKSPNMVMPVEASGLTEDDMNDGEMLVHTLYPDIYSLEVEFRGLGFANIKKENIQVEQNKTTEVEIVINKNDITGIEGKVLDTNGIILKGGGVYFSPQSIEIRGKFITTTDQNGYYRLTGMPEGFYKIMLSAELPNGKEYMWSQEIVEIKKDVLLKKDIIMKYTFDELELQ
jgi:hypothetical protein